MRALSPELQAKLDSGETTLARCWRVTRRDGQVLGFTDHDLVLTFDGVSYEPDSGFGPASVEAATGLSVDSTEITGALRSTRISSEDVQRGLYDGAEVLVFLVDWQDPTIKTVLTRGHIGEIRRGETALEAEIVGLSDRLNQPTGRAFLHACGCRLGDAKCGIDTTNAAFRGTGVVDATTDPQQMVVTGIGAFDAGWFTNGALVWTSGANAGQSAHVKVHLGDVLELWLAPPLAIQPGDTFTITAGCDRTAETCAARFDNLLNFRGFPHIPGDDWAANYPSAGEKHDGGSLFRT